MSAAPRAEPGSGSLRFPALLWALLHVPLILLLYAGSAGIALTGIPPRYQAALLVLYTVEAAVTAGLAFAVALPLSPWPRLYRLVAPAMTGLMMIVLFIDSRLYASLGFHINGLFFKVIVQPNMMQEVGLSRLELGLLVAAWALWLALSIWGGAVFLRRFARARRVWTWLLLLFALEAGDRLTVASLNFFGGPAVFAAGQVLPLQIRFTMSRMLSRWTGRPRIADPLEVAARRSQAHLPTGVAPDAVHFTTRPDIIIALIESTRSDFLDSLTMPRLWRRAKGGTTFLRHYTAATSTHYSVFSLFYALQSQKLEAVVGAGRPPLLFGVLRANNYAPRLIAASSVDWMGMRTTVFGSVEHDLESMVPGRDGAERDQNMLVSARRFVTTVHPDQPLFLFVFFDGTHFNYSFPPDATPFTPYWDGRGSSDATRVAPLLLEHRARNAAWEVDRKLDAFLTWFTARRGRAPLVVITGDHGEEYREHGRVGHGFGVTEEQVHVPMVLVGPGVPVGRVDAVTSSVDIVPTLFGLLGDTANSSLYSDGFSLFAPPPDRFVLTSVGWEPKFAVIGRDIKAAFATYDAGLGSVRVTDPWDQPLPPGDDRFAREAPAILRAFAPRAEP